MQLAGKPDGIFRSLAYRSKFLRLISLKKLLDFVYKGVVLNLRKTDKMKSE